VTLRPEDVTVEVLMVQSGGGFAPLKTHGVKLTHTPTGIVVQCSSERSQHRNREQALRDLERYLHGARPQPTPPAAQPAPVQERLHEAFSKREQDRWLSEIADELDDPTLTSFSQVATGIRDLKERLSTPPAAQRQWVGLTDQEIRDTYEWCSGQSEMDRCRAIEGKLKGKNT
jgi:hypothetical protein